MINVPDSTSNDPLLSNRLTPIDPSQVQKQGQSQEVNSQEQSKKQSESVFHESSSQIGGGIYDAKGKVENGENVTDGQKLANDIQSIKDNVHSLDPVVNSGELEVMQSSFTQALNTSNDLAKSMNSFLMNI